MARPTGMSLAVLLALTLGPALAIGATLWFVTGLIPECAVREQQRLPAPDGAFDLVIFARDCGATTGANTQAALVPPGEAVPFDAASFVSVGAQTDLAPRWTGDGGIEMTLPPTAEIYRRDASVAGIAVSYR